MIRSRWNRNKSVRKNLSVAIWGFFSSLGGRLITREKEWSERTGIITPSEEYDRNEYGPLSSIPPGPKRAFTRTLACGQRHRTNTTQRNKQTNGGESKTKVIRSPFVERNSDGENGSVILLCYLVTREAITLPRNATIDRVKRGSSYGKAGRVSIGKFGGNTILSSSFALLPAASGLRAAFPRPKKKEEKC